MRPSTARAQLTHLRTFLSYLIFMQLPLKFSLHNIITFLEFLYQSSLSPKVISNYLSSIRSMTKFYNIEHSDLSHIAVSRFLRSITINSRFSPTPRGVFDIHTLYRLSLACDSLSDPILYRAIFLTAFFAFLRMSNMAPHSARAFDPTRHFLRQDLIFADPGVHLLIKWTKTLQSFNSHHIVQLPTLANIMLCPVRALKALLSSRPLSPAHPLFANNFPPFSPIIDTHIRDALKKVLSTLNISSVGHGFHTFRRSGATFAFDHNVSLQNIMAHGLWRSSAIWSYLQNASLAPSTIPNTFAASIPRAF